MQYGDAWFDELKGEELDEIMKIANEKLKLPTKGIEKGKQKPGANRII